MTIAGGDKERRYYSCSRARQSSTCPNRASVRESLAREHIVAAIRQKLGSHTGLAYIRERLAAQLAKRHRGSDGVLTRLKAQLVEVEDQIANLVDFLARGQQSRHVAQRLAALEAEEQTLSKKVAATQAAAQAPVRLPTLDDARRVVAMIDRLADDADRGRALLRELLGGAIRMEPDADGVYTAYAELLPIGVLLSDVKVPPEQGPGGTYTRMVAGARNAVCTTWWSSRSR